jgi:hypothetical protein
MKLSSARGSDCNKVKIGGTTTLHGDPAKKVEKGHTIVLFPGGSVEISRTTDEHYWVHVAVDRDSKAAIVDARVDANGSYMAAANEALKTGLETADVEHIAFLVKP